MKARKYLFRQLVLLIAVSMMHLPAYSRTYKWKIVDREFDSIAALLENAAEDEPETARNRLERLRILSNEKKNPVLGTRYRYWNASLLGDGWDSTENDESKINYLTETLSYIDSSKYDYDYARTIFLMLTSPNSAPNYLNQYENLTAILPVFKKYEDYLYQGNCYRYLGILFSELVMYEQAEMHLKQAEECFKKANNPESVAINTSNQAVLLFHSGKKDSSANLFRSLLQNPYIRKSPKLLASIYINLSLATTSQAEQRIYQDSAQEIITSNPQLAETEYNYSLIANKARRYLQSDKIDSAIDCYQEILHSANRNRMHNVMAATLYGLSECYARKKDYAMAYRYIMEFNYLQDSLRGTEKSNTINRIETSTTINEYQTRLSEQAQKMALQKKLTKWIVFSIALLSLVMAVITLYLRNKKKLAETTLKNKELINRQLQQEIDHQNRELSTNLLILSENRNFLQQILGHLEKLRSKGEISNPCELDLRKMISTHIQNKDEWENFKIHFEKIHPEFFSKLKERHPGLTANDLRLCAYIRIGLTIKQISQMTSVLPASINTNRYLIKKKLALDESQSLDSYIFSL